MKRLLLLVVLLITTLAWAVMECPYHPGTSSCYSTGQVRYVNGQAWEKYHCTCGDEFWVKQ